MRNPPPPQVNSAVQVSSAVQRQSSTAETNYAAVAEAFRANSGAEARAIRALFGGDKQLMDRFLAVAFAALAKNSDILQRATPISIVQAIKEAAALGLEPFTDDGSIIVYGTTAKFMPMWSGYVKRIRNSGKVVDIDCHVVYEADEFRLTLGTDSNVHHVPALVLKDAMTGEILRDRDGFLGAYAWALMPSGTKIVEWMTEAEINKIRDQYGSKRSDAWTGSYGEMARKTVIRRLAKRLPAAAVDALLTADAQVDAANDEERRAIATMKDDMADLRRLALNAVGIPTPSTTGQEDAQPPAAVEVPIRLGLEAPGTSTEPVDVEEQRERYQGRADPS